MSEQIYHYWIEARLTFRGEAIDTWKRSQESNGAPFYDLGILRRIVASRRGEALNTSSDYRREYRICRQQIEVIE